MGWQRAGHEGTTEISFTFHDCILSTNKIKRSYYQTAGIDNGNTRNIIIIIIISDVIYVTKCNIKSFLAMIENSTVIDCILLNRRMRFISGLCCVNNSSLQLLFNVTAKQELIKVIGLMGLGTVVYLGFKLGPDEGV